MSKKKFISVDFDKFNNKTTTRTLPLNKYRTQSCIVWDMDAGTNNRNYSLATNIRHIKTPDQDMLLLDFDLMGESWMFFRRGNIQIVCDTENIDIKANESFSDTISGGGIEENFYYIIDQKILKKLCDAKDLSVRLNGDKYVEIGAKGTKYFQRMCQQFYNNFYDDGLYLDSLSKSAKNNSGCFIATAAMGDYNHPLVMELRLFRDNWLLKKEWGVKFTSWYYTHGPKAAILIEKSSFLKKIILVFLIKPLNFFIKKLKLGRF